MQNEGGHSGPNSLPPLPFPSLSQGHEPAHEPGLGGGSPRRPVKKAAAFRPVDGEE